MLQQIIKSRLNLSNSKRNIINNTLWLLSGTVLQRCLGVFVGIWVARYLGPDQYGLLSYAAAFVSLFVPFTSLGLNRIVIRDLVRDPSCRDETLGTVFVLRFLATFLMVCLVVGTIFLFNSNNSLVLWMVGILAVGMIFQTFDTISLWFHSQVQAKYPVRSGQSAALLVSMIKIALIRLRASLIAFSWVVLVERALPLFVPTTPYCAN